MRAVAAACAVYIGQFWGMSFAVAETMSYQACVQDCRENLPPETTLKQCIVANSCHRYPRKLWSYEDCVERCQDEANSNGPSVQQCIAQYVCSQHPRK